MQHAIYLRHRRKILLPPGDGAAPPELVATLLKNIESLGFTGSAALIDHLRTLGPNQISDVYAQLVPELRKIVGAHKHYKPMYPGFPKQVMQASKAELYLNAILHYLTLDLPDETSHPRLPLISNLDLRVIDLGDEADFRRICTQLLAAKSALSAVDRADIDWFFKHYGDEALKFLPEIIPVREHVALLATYALRYTGGSATVLRRYIATATDVLRLAVALSHGDVSLAEPARFRRFKRAERRLLLDLLEDRPNLVEDMLRRREPWKRLGERLHPGDYQSRYPRSYAAFTILRNDLPVETFRNQVETAITAGEYEQALRVLATRPGELARRLDHLLRISADQAVILNTFGIVAVQVSTPVLLQVLAHFRRRNDPPPLRTFFPKGNVAKAQAIANTLPALDAESQAGVVTICRETLIERFRALPPLGRVFVDPQLRNYPVPLSQRSASKALRTIPRGSRLPLSDGSTVRFFLWWHEGVVNGKPTGRVDIDLSAVLYDGDWCYQEHISYTNLKSGKYRAAHSGDIVTAPNGACEFIDLDIQSALKYNIRYLVMSINAYSRQPFCDLPECFAGWMLRDEPMSGEIFEPRTVQDRIDVAADTRICLPLIIDLVARQVIWCDLALQRNPRWFNNVEGNQKGMLLMGQAMTSLVKPDLHELFILHTIARGSAVPRDQAEIVFAPDGDVTPFDIATILAEYV